MVRKNDVFENISYKKYKLRTKAMGLENALPIGHLLLIVEWGNNICCLTFLLRIDDTENPNLWNVQK